MGWRAGLVGGEQLADAPVDGVLLDPPVPEQGKGATAPQDAMDLV